MSYLGYKRFRVHTIDHAIRILWTQVLRVFSVMIAHAYVTKYVISKTKCVTRDGVTRLQCYIPRSRCEIELVLTSFCQLDLKCQTLTHMQTERQTSY